MKFFFIFKIIVVTFCFSFFVFSILEVDATIYLTKISDLLSTSAPGAYANQTIRFVLNQEIPADGAIEVYFDEGGFDIPGTLNYTDIDVSFSSTYGGPSYTDRPLSSVQSAGTDDVTVTSGSSGMIRIDLNTSIGIPAGNEVMIEIGTNATYGGTGDVQFQLSSATSSYPVTIYTYDATDIELDYGRTMIAVVDQVTIGPVDTTDTTPPVILSAEPTGILQVGTRGVELSVQTDETSECKYATSSMAYSLMPYFLTGTTSGLTIWHFAQITGLEDGTDYTYYLSCVDYRLNEIDPDYVLTFTVGVDPGSSSSTATSTGTGTGTGSSTASSTCTGSECNGTGTGSGSGGSGSGSGSSPNGGNGAGGGNGGSSGGDKLQQADVKIEGWAYPGATVSFFRDGLIVTTKNAGIDASFSNLTEGLDRGSYSFGIYAVDSKGTRSATFSTTLWLQPDTLNVLSNIMLPPTLHVIKNSISSGVPFEVSGYSSPNARVTTWLRPKLAEVSSSDIVATTTANSNGFWSLSLKTTGLTDGTYELVAQAKKQDGLVESDKSARKTVGIGVEVADGDCKQIGDLNCDGFVNLVDFSILLFNWNTSNEIADVNGDTIVSLPDFSVMLYYWTG